MIWRALTPSVTRMHMASPRLAAAAFAAAASFSMSAFAESGTLVPPVPGKFLQITTPSSASSGLRIVTYNVLSSHLCDPDYYVHSPPEDLHPPTRLQRVKDQLQDEMARGAVICLQEVSTLWAGDLTPFFEANGYTMVTGLYGRRFNGYMGVALAWPSYRFQSEEVDISAASDTKPWPKPPPGSEKSGLKAWTGKVWRSLKGLVRKPPARPEVEPWAESQKRANILLSARLRDSASGRVFCVSTYHMPCLFGSVPKSQAPRPTLAPLTAADLRQRPLLPLSCR